MIFERQEFDNYPSNLGYVTLLKYFPKRYSVQPEYIDNRNVVFDFKNGIANATVDHYFVQELLRLRQISIDWHITPIPASKTTTNNQRFSALITRLSKGSGLINGTLLLQPVSDRDNLHQNAERNYEKILPSLSFHNAISGKNIVLIDDVSTRGKSYRLIASELLRRGAKRVAGVILAKTTWPEQQTFSPEAGSDFFDDLPF
jgi:hypothetical protein